MIAATLTGETLEGTRRVEIKLPSGELTYALWPINMLFPDKAYIKSNIEFVLCDFHNKDKGAIAYVINVYSKKDTQFPSTQKLKGDSSYIELSKEFIRFNGGNKSVAKGEDVIKKLKEINTNLISLCNKILKASITDATIAGSLGIVGYASLGATEIPSLLIDLNTYEADLNSISSESIKLE